MNRLEERTVHEEVMNVFNCLTAKMTKHQSILEAGCMSKVSRKLARVCIELDNSRVKKEEAQVYECKGEG